MIDERMHVICAFFFYLRKLCLDIKLRHLLHKTVLCASVLDVVKNRFIVGALVGISI